MNDNIKEYLMEAIENNTPLHLESVESAELGYFIKFEEIDVELFIHNKGFETE